jgi:murein L,D-transpeptidase YcbB/YkuD
MEKFFIKTALTGRNSIAIIFPCHVRQREGKENFGIDQVWFDNPHAVFLHDTNAKSLFRNKVRAYSHGCVRMEKAVELGHYLLSGSVTGRSPALDKYLAQGQRHFVNLPQSVSIFIRYFTCEVVDNKFYVYDDCYDMDKEVAGSLYRPR